MKLNELTPELLEKAKKCEEKICEIRYKKAVSAMEQNDFDSAKKLFESIGYTSMIWKCKRKEDEYYKSLIFYYFIECSGHKSIKAIKKECRETRKLSDERLTHLLSSMIVEGKLSKEYIDKTSYYSIA